MIIFAIDIIAKVSERELAPLYRLNWTDLGTNLFLEDQRTKREPKTNLKIKLTHQKGIFAHDRIFMNG